MNDFDTSDSHVVDLDPKFQASIQRLHELTVLGRWLAIIALWLTVGAASLWGLRYPISLMQEYFTWAALRNGLANHPISAMGLGLCIGLTIGVLVWQSRNILFGLPKDEQERLEKMVLRIRQQGESHPLWKWLETENQTK
jgi:hypothetical protein